MVESSKAPVFSPDLDGVIVAETRLSVVDGDAGTLRIGGYPVGEIAPKASFEEALSTLWDGVRPDKARTAEVVRQLAAHRELPQAIKKLLRVCAADSLPPIDLLRSAVSCLSTEEKEWNPFKVVSIFPVIVATYHYLVPGNTPPRSRKSLGHSANFLYMIHGELPQPHEVRALDTYLNAMIDHAINPSTFAARVVVSTGADDVAALTAALAALKGPLHGGAPAPVLSLLMEGLAASDMEMFLSQRISSGGRVPGFGHAVYKVRDPRADVLSNAAKEVFERSGQGDFYQAALRYEATVLRLLAQAKPGRTLNTNVEFYAALVLHSLRLPPELFTPLFAVARVPGWLAHCAEQRGANKLVRPLSRYIGTHHHHW